MEGIEAEGTVETKLSLTDERRLMPNLIERISGLLATASPAPWETINHEAGCPSFGYCSPNGCGGHESNVAYDVSGPILLKDGEVSGDSEEEDRQQFRQADIDAKLIAELRNAAPALMDVVKAAERADKAMNALLHAFSTGVTDSRLWIELRDAGVALRSKLAVLEEL
jgi:hypothetical protein